MPDLIRSWVETANAPQSPFPLNNLPYGVFSAGDSPRCAVAIGNSVLDLGALQSAGVLPEHGFASPALNTFMGKGKKVWTDVRQKLTELLREGNKTQAVADALHDMSSVTTHLPFTVTEYTDFYAGRQHAFNVGSLFRDPKNALPPNWLHMPIGYNGRASTVVVSGTDFHRPMGQLKGPQDDTPRFGPSKRLDIELEMGAVVGTPSEMGQRISVDQADDMIFGYVLLNDWSARDIQAWEYQPLGPFQAKAFATTIGAWVVTKAALDPFRCDTPPREHDLLRHIKDTGPMLYDIDLSVTMAAPDGEATEICRTNYNTLYYSAAQQLAHHASSGCAMRTGDLLGSGTISGPEKGMFGSLLEMTWGGRDVITLDDGQTRTFIEDGDTLTLNGHAQGDGYRIGFGPCTGTILPARRAKDGRS
ncbi:fumarylacetoacetase [Primorskyibacter flagellatus]|uniref:fumarylacetoacetase n=1 Tax=Primorskyibacter flagellatus TaxID=1387277 RepID=A0A1W2CAH4_9RHOB|nr:fumarylacetoacetase [Primorskyibacter flagellatus]SMC82131.1 fumarylacetoacetate hydrolase [Primorskyibacter flagellatus]